MELYVWCLEWCQVRLTPSLAERSAIAATTWLVLIIVFKNDVPNKFNTNKLILKNILFGYHRGGVACSADVVQYWSWNPNDNWLQRDLIQYINGHRAILLALIILINEEADDNSIVPAGWFQSHMIFVLGYIDSHYSDLTRYNHPIKIRNLHSEPQNKFLRTFYWL